MRRRIGETFESTPVVRGEDGPVRERVQPQVGAERVGVRELSRERRVVGISPEFRAFLEGRVVEGAGVGVRKGWARRAPRRAA